MITFTPVTITNNGQPAGTQTDVRTAALGNGGYVSAWTRFVAGTSNVSFSDLMRWATRWGL